MAKAITKADDLLNEEGVLCADKDEFFRLGLTKREYFAVMAMQSFLSTGGTSKEYKLMIAEHSVKMADYLIKELNKEK